MIVRIYHARRGYVYSLFDTLVQHQQLYMALVIPSLLVFAVIRSDDSFASQYGHVTRAGTSRACIPSTPTT